jgi:hypothetical protein
MKEIKLILLLYLLTVPLPSYPQGEMLNKGNNGAFSSYSYVFGPDATGWIGNLGFSFKGIIDFSINYGKSSLKKNTELEYLKWSSIQYSISFHLLKGEIDSTFGGIGLNLSYSDMTYTTDNWVHVNTPYWVNDELTVKGNIIMASIHSYVNVGIGYPGILQAIGSVGLIMADAKHSKIKVNSGVFSFGIGMNIGFYLTSSILLNASPAVAIVENKNSFGFNIGITILTNRL